MKELVKTFKVLSDDTRLRILNLIMVRECCVCEVMQVLEISQSKASRGLTALYDVGFLKQRKEGLWSLYSIDENMASYLSDLVSAAKKALVENKITVLDRERLKKATRTGSCALTKVCKT